MEKRLIKLRDKSFKKSLLDRPVPNLKSSISLRDNIPKLEIIKSLPKPLQPTKYKPPIPKLRAVPKSKLRIKPKTISKPRVKKVDNDIKKFIDKIAPYYKPKAIQEFNKNLKGEMGIITEMKKALKRAARSLRVAILDRKDPARQLYFTKLAVADELKSIFNRDGAMKFYITLLISFKKNNSEGETVEADAYFNSKTLTILDPDDIIDALDRAEEKINNEMAVWLSKGSGWTVKEVSKHFVNIVKYLPLRAGSYVQLPKKLRNPKKGLINLQNEDDKCILWCITRYFNPCISSPSENNKR